MHVSTITSKGQTTIPKEIRIILSLKANDRIVFVADGKRVFLTPISGTILDLAGSVKHRGKKPIDFSGLRESVKARIAKDVTK